MKNKNRRRLKNNEIVLMRARVNITLRRLMNNIRMRYLNDNDQTMFAVVGTSPELMSEMQTIFMINDKGIQKIDHSLEAMTHSIEYTARSIEMLSEPLICVTHSGEQSKRRGKRKGREFGRSANHY